MVFVDTKSDLNVYKEGILSQDAVDVADAGAACCAAKPKPKPKPELKENGKFPLRLCWFAILTAVRLLRS